MWNLSSDVKREYKKLYIAYKLDMDLCQLSGTYTAVPWKKYITEPGQGNIYRLQTLRSRRYLVSSAGFKQNELSTAAS